MAIDSQVGSANIDDAQTASIPHEHEVMIRDALSKDSPIAFDGGANSKHRSPALRTQRKAT